MLHKLYYCCLFITLSSKGKKLTFFKTQTDGTRIPQVRVLFPFFPERCRKLPKGLKDWQAFLDLKKRIDDFSELCPLLEMMTNKVMKQRHWDRISELTGTPFDVESDSFCLRNIMEAPLLKNKDDIEVCKRRRSQRAVKEGRLFLSVTSQGNI